MGADGTSSMAIEDMDGTGQLCLRFLALSSKHHMVLYPTIILHQPSPDSLIFVRQIADFSIDENMRA
jgi:hypothetical protein